MFAVPKTPRPVTPAQWLIGHFLDTDPEAFSSEVSRLDGAEIPQPGPCGSVFVQPMFTLKDLADAGETMTVAASDYADPDGRLL